MIMLRHLLPTSRLPMWSAQNLVWCMALADTFGALVQNFVPITMLLRGCLCFYFVVHAILLARSTLVTKLLWVGVIGFFVLRVLVDYLILRDERALAMEVGTSLRLLYFPLFYGYLRDQLDRGWLLADDLRDGLLTYGWMVLASLFIGEISGLGGVIGARGTNIDGGKGFMIGANEVGLLLLLTAPFVVRHCLQMCNNILLAACIGLALYLAAGVYVFTKSSLIASVVATYAVYRMSAQRSGAARGCARAVLLGGFLYGCYLVVKNLDVIEAFASGTFFAALLDEGIIAFLFRGRYDYIDAIVPQLIEHPMNWLIVLFGAGEYYARHLSLRPLGLPSGEGSLFEMDFSDLFVAYGVAGTLCYTALLWPIAKRACSVRFPPEILVALIGTLAHAFMAGHVVFSPQVTTLVALVLLQYSLPRRAAGA
ncbi:hypothetical protein [Massilia sp. TSP1-1-2]|uniref:hypothetical protein n=1 Tax=Massilia sp. TSP1-1-2 TaxID=2804649 RepID=UPI003CED023A